MYRFLLVICLLITANPSFSQNWRDGKTVKKQLIHAAYQGKTYYSQYNIYNPRISEKTTSDYTRILAVKPYIYGVDFYYAGGTWQTRSSVIKSRTNLIKIVKEAWEENKAIPCFSWHLENPYAPSSFGKEPGYRYIDHKSVPDYPKEHHYVIAEIIKGKGDTCGMGNLSGTDNLKQYPNPGVWFEDRCKEVAGIINEFVDDKGKPIPFIFRLWHEWEDSWMWWGAEYVSAEDYKRFFILTEQTIKKYAPKAQILWAYCSDRFWKTEDEYLERYPGDDYVDIIGFDDYSIGLSEENLIAAADRAAIVSKIAKKRKLASALFETNNNKQKVPGYYTKYLNRMLKSPGVNLGVVQIWSLKNFNDSTDMRSFISQKNIISLLDKRKQGAP